MQLVTSKFKESTLIQARKAEKYGVILAIVATGNLMISWTLYSLKFTTDILEVVESVVNALSGFYIDFTNSLFQFVYFNFSLQICWLFQQLKEELEAIEPQKDDKEIQKTIGKVVETHQDVLEVVSTTVKMFKSVLSFNFVINIAFIGQSMILSKEENWKIFLLSTPFLLFDAWIFCYASQKIITKVTNFHGDSKKFTYFNRRTS
jgi:hypothetical protein